MSAFKYSVDLRHSLFSHSHTFVLAELDIGKQSDLDDLPQQTQH